MVALKMLAMCCLVALVAYSTTAQLQRMTWPALMGQPGSSAEAVIHATDPRLNVIVLPENAPVTLDFRLDRVRVFVNTAGIIVREPMVG